jgi:16S rRNA (guanine(966)-N(2))-methyltransferase RsmD
MVRGAIFSVLESVAIDWTRVVDLYAGTGALGIEALSRGAERADFVERKPRSCALIKENLELTGFAPQARVYCMTAAKALSILEEEYGILLLDPPYDDTSIGSYAEKLVSSRLVGAESTIVIEHSPRITLGETYGDFRQIRDLRYGDSSVAVYQYAEGAS